MARLLEMRVTVAERRIRHDGRRGDTNAPPRLRGRLAAWLLEIRAGVFVGDYSARTRERIWEQVVGGIENGDAVMGVERANRSRIRLSNDRRERRTPIDFGGLKLVSFMPVPRMRRDEP